MTNYLEGVIADIMSTEGYTQGSLRKECAECDTEDDYALYLTRKHIREIRAWKAPIEISRGPEGRYLEDQPPEVQAIEVYLEFYRAIVDP